MLVCLASQSLHILLCQRVFLTSEDVYFLSRREDSTFIDVTQVVDILERFAHEVYGKLGARMHRLAVAVWEIRVRLKEVGVANGAWRVVVSNPTGHTCTVQVTYARHQ